MGSLDAAGMMFAAVSAAGLASLMFGWRLPAHHLDAESRDAVRLVAGFLATMAALVLGLLIASAKANYAERSDQLHRIAADVVALDRALSRFGQEAQPVREILRFAFIDQVDRLSAGNRLRGSVVDQPVQDARLLGFHELLENLVPRTDGQRAARQSAAQIAENIAATRVLMTQDREGSIPTPFLFVLGFWLTAMFASFGLFTRANGTVVAAVLVGAASVAGAVFLILELDRPLDGFMRLSTEPLRHAVDVIGR